VEKDDGLGKGENKEDKKEVANKGASATDGANPGANASAQVKKRSRNLNKTFKDKEQRIKNLSDLLNKMRNSKVNQKPQIF
jgi:hypothetical protein